MAVLSKWVHQSLQHFDFNFRAHAAQMRHMEEMLGNPLRGAQPGMLEHGGGGAQPSPYRQGMMMMPSQMSPFGNFGFGMFDNHMARMSQMMNNSYVYLYFLRLLWLCFFCLLLDDDSSSRTADKALYFIGHFVQATQTFVFMMSNCENILTFAQY